MLGGWRCDVFEIPVIAILVAGERRWKLSRRFCPFGHYLQSIRVAHRRKAMGRSGKLRNASVTASTDVGLQALTPTPLGGGRSSSATTPTARLPCHGPAWSGATVSDESTFDFGNYCRPDRSTQGCVVRGGGTGQAGDHMLSIRRRTWRRKSSFGAKVDRDARSHPVQATDPASSRRGPSC